jgi:hypothetical protein
MTLYNTPLEPGLQISVNTVNTQIAAVGAFNTLYLLAYPGQQSDLPSYTSELITSLEDYKRRIGGQVPTDYLGLVNYLTVAAAYKNLKNTGAIKVIAVRAPSQVYTITAGTLASVGSTISYKLDINGVIIDKAFVLGPLTGGQTEDNFIANRVAQDIAKSLELSNSVYVRDVFAGQIELTPFVEGQQLSITVLPGTALGSDPNLAVNLGPAPYVIPEAKDYLQALTLGINEDSELGVIVAPGFYATASSAEALLFTKQADSFCRQAEYQQLFISDVVNPDLKRIPEFSTINSYDPLLGVATNALFEFKGSIYKGLSANGIAPIDLAQNATSVLVGQRIVLPQAVTINNVTSQVVQAVQAQAFVNINQPTALELSSFIAITEQQIINEALFVNAIGLIESGSASEQSLYRFRDNFNSVEGHVSTAAPYQFYTGPELSLEAQFALPAAIYQASLWIYVANTIGVFTPPASDDFPLEATKGPIWQVTKAGHALLNGKGINIVKTINSAAYIMGSRTQSQNDLYNRQNARVILSLYVKTLRLALKQGLVLKPLTSSGSFLAELKAKADRVSRAFYEAGLLDGNSENEAFDNKCDASINSLSDLQQGIIKLESKIAQIGMTEKIVVTVQESLIGSLNTIL